jgi:hypothetical protein
MSNLLESAKAIVYTLLSHHKGEVTDEILVSFINKASAINIIEGLEFDKQELFEILKAELSIGKGEITILSENIEPWLNDEKVNIKFSLWNRYKAYLKNNDSSFPISELDDFTDKILDKYPEFEDLLYGLTKNKSINAIPVIKKHIKNIISSNSTLLHNILQYSPYLGLLLVTYHYDKIKSYFYSRYGKELIEWIYNPKNMAKWGHLCWNLDMKI